MDTIYFDWGRGKVTTLLNDSDHIVYYRSVDELLDSLTEPHNIVSEATFESYEPTTRAKVIERARAAGHNWLTTPNRQRTTWTPSTSIGDVAKIGRAHV